MKKLVILFGLILAACQSCHPIIGPFPGPAPQPEPPSPWPDPFSPADASGDAAPPVDVDWCPAACARGTQLKCSWAQPTQKGASCVDVCEAHAGSPVSMQADCVARATSCADADACGAIPNK